MENSNDKVAAYLTHELRSPLQALRFALELLKKDLHEGETEKNKRIVGAALCATDRMNLHIADILEMSKVQMGQTRIAREACAPADLARETASYFEAWAARKWIRLSVAAEENLPEVSADPRRVVQALTNLITNALKFTPPAGSIEVRVRRGQRERAGTVLFSVKDSGCGIPPEELPRIFRYFVTAGATEGEPEGSGLGLPLARSFVELQGGEMWVETRVGEGATFHFTLPVDLGAVGPKPAAADTQRYPGLAEPLS